MYISSILHVYCMYISSILHVYCMYIACIFQVYCMYIALYCMYIACIFQVYCIYIACIFHVYCTMLFGKWQLYLIHEFVSAKCERETCSIAYFSIYVLVFLPEEGRMERSKRVVAKYINERTAFRCCVCVDFSRYWHDSYWRHCHDQRYQRPVLPPSALSQYSSF